MEKIRPNFAGHVAFITNPIHARVTLFHLRAVLTQSLTGNTSKSDRLGNSCPSSRWWAIFVVCLCQVFLFVWIKVAATRYRYAEWTWIDEEQHFKLFKEPEIMKEEDIEQFLGPQFLLCPDVN